MSTIPSPQPSVASVRSPTPTGSQRLSLDTLPTSTANPRHASPSPAPTQRRNRAALRDYYNLKSSRTSSITSNVPATSSSPTHNNHPDGDTSLLSSELDNPDFAPEAYVQSLLTTLDLAAVLKAEGALVSEIKTLDGERKALVYDNYSKLIGAVETIGKMRGSMEADGKMTAAKTLGPAVGYIANAAAGIVEEGRANESGSRKRREQKETVRWVLNAPNRLSKLVEADRREEAEEDWEEVKALLEEWQGVAGVGEVRVKCEKALAKEEE